MIFNNSGMMRFNDDENSSKDKNQSTENKPPQTKREFAKDVRREKQISRKVKRKYNLDQSGLDEDGKITNNEQYQAARKKEGLGMDKRRERGRQFFVELAKNLASDDTPYVPKERKPNPTSNGGVEGSTGYEWKKEYTRSGNKTDVTTPEEDAKNNAQEALEEQEENSAETIPGPKIGDYGG